METNKFICFIRNNTMGTSEFPIVPTVCLSLMINEILV